MTAPVATGTRPTGNPQTAATPTVTIGGVPATVLFAGEAPCCVGLNQINATMPALPTSGVGNYSAVPITMTIGGQNSNTVTVATGTTIGGVSGTAQSVSGKIGSGEITKMGLDLPLGTSSIGAYSLSGNGVNSSAQAVYSLTGSGSGTVTSCLIVGGANASGNWTASGTMTVTVKSRDHPTRRGIGKV